MFTVTVAGPIPFFFLLVLARFSLVVSWYSMLFPVHPLLVRI